jgi:ribose transport system ATP-binding protein
MTSGIQIEHVTKRYGGVTALDDVSFSVALGEFHAIVGENGAGKSTLMKILSGVITEFQGSVSLNGTRLRFHGTRDAESSGIAIIHQELNLVEQLSVSANMFLGREITTAGGWLDETSMEQEAARQFKRLGCLIDPQEKVSRLRIGDQQLVEIAKSLLLNAEILIMDEPTSALTEGEVERLFEVINLLRKQGVTILYISHKMDEVFRLSDRITVLRDGCWISTTDRADTTPQEVTHLLVGREIDAGNWTENRQSGDVILKVDSLSLPWPGHAREWRLKDISFELCRGEVLGVAGLMGAGRTELLECLFGTSQDRPQGRITLDGQPIRPRHPSDAIRAGVALVTEDRKRLGLFDQLNVRENISMCTLSEFASKIGLVSTAKENQRVGEAMKTLTVKADSMESSILSLSGGNQQKCVIARWLETEPILLLLDDPTRGVDVGAKAEIYTIIAKLCREGMALIVTSSELPELISICDRILVLCEGQQTGEFERSNFSEEAIMEAATSRSTCPQIDPT